MRAKESSYSKPVIGLTGSIGAGKSTVSDILESLGAFVVNSDRLAHAALEEPEVRSTLRAWWGDDVCRSDGSVDRKIVADKVFERPEELARLEGVLYPRIENRRRALMESADRDSRVQAMVIDAPKLVEAGLHQQCDVLVVVDAERSIRERRVSRRGWDVEELRRRENLLEPLDKKRDLADHVVVNNTDLEDLHRRIALLFDTILRDFTQKHS